MKRLTHSAINIKLFRRFNFTNDHLYEVELVKSEIEHREAIIVGFFFLQYANLRMLKLCYNFFKKFCHTEKYEELEMDTDYIYLAVSEENLEDIYFPEEEKRMGSNTFARLYRKLHCECNGQLLPKNMLYCSQEA